MEKVEDVRVKPLSNSLFIQPYTVFYKHVRQCVLITVGVYKTTICTGDYSGIRYAPTRCYLGNDVRVNAVAVEFVGDRQPAPPYIPRTSM